MARIPYPDLSRAPEEVRTRAANLPPLNIFRMLPHAPTFLRGFGQLGAAILSRHASALPRFESEGTTGAIRCARPSCSY